jgi:hypothetical protein
MDIFISWHGKRSLAAAEALRGWLPLIVNAFKPWLSSADIDKGARWRSELSNKLGTATAGIFCLTPSNLTAPWLLFEAGAISRAPETAYVCTLLVDLQPSDVKDPLAQFQATRATKEEIHQLVKNLNKSQGEDRMDDALLNRSFEKWWPDLDEQLKKLPSDDAAPPPQRSEREMIQELLDKVRDLSQVLQPRPYEFANLKAFQEMLVSPIDSRLRERNESVHHPDVLRKFESAHNTIAVQDAAAAAIKRQGTWPATLAADAAHIGLSRGGTAGGTLAADAADPSHPQKQQGEQPPSEPGSK